MKTNTIMRQYAYEILEVLSHELVELKIRHPERTVYDIFSQGHSSFNWYEVIINLLSDIYPDHRSVNINRKREDKLYGGKIWLNSKYKGKKVDDVLDFYFDRFFPEVIWKLHNQGDIHFNNNRLGDLLGDLLNITVQDIESYVRERAGIKMAFNYHDRDFSGTSSEYGSKSSDDIIREKIVDELKIFKKVIINYFWGILSNAKQSMFYCDDISMLPKYCHNLLNIIIEKFEKDIVYLDTDEIYFRYTKHFDLEKFKQILDLTDLPYKFENGTEKLANVFDEYFREQLLNGEKLIDNSLYDGVFLDIKKYFLFKKDGSLLRMKGIITYKDKLEQKLLDNKINKFYKNKKWIGGGLTLQGPGDTAMFQGQTEWGNYCI
jgi:hypothetical protein